MSIHATRLRARVALQRIELDRALADGADPSGDPALGLRADQLTDPRTRRGIASALGHILDAAEEPPETWGPNGSRPPLQRDDVLAAREVLLAVAARLHEPGFVPARAVALAAVLVWDSASPTYAPGTGATVARFAETILELMGPAAANLPA